MSSDPNVPNQLHEAALRIRKLELEVEAAQNENALRARKLAVEATIAEEEVNFRVKKLDADLRVSQRQASRASWLLEWLKAAAVPIALVGVLATSTLSMFQISVANKQAETAAEQAQNVKDQFRAQAEVTARQIATADRDRRLERLDAAVERLTREPPGERIAAVLKIKLLLGSGHQETDALALVALINQLMSEPDPIVRASIKEVLTPNVLSKLDRAALSQVLLTSVERSRILLQLAVTEQESSNILVLRTALEEKAGRKLFEYGLRDLYDEAQKLPSLSDIHDVIAKSYPLPKEYSEKASIVRDPSATLGVKLTPGLATQLVDIADIIESLAVGGARVSDMRGIYCEGCRFNAMPQKSMQDVVFDDAVLDRANFAGLDLARASFRRASITGAIFNQSDLTKAVFAMNPGRVPHQRIMMGKVSLPQFDCAILAGADMTGVPLVGVSAEYYLNGVKIIAHMVNLKRATVDSKTNLDRIWLTSEKSTYIGKDGKGSFSITDEEMEPNSFSGSTKLEPPTEVLLRKLTEFIPRVDNYKDFSVEKWMRHGSWDVEHPYAAGGWFLTRTTDDLANYTLSAITRQLLADVFYASGVERIGMMQKVIESAGLPSPSRKTSEAFESAATCSSDLEPIPYSLARRSLSVALPWFRTEETVWGQVVDKGAR